MTAVLLEDRRCSFMLDAGSAPACSTSTDQVSHLLVPAGPAAQTTTSFHRFFLFCSEVGTNIYRKPPIYKQGELDSPDPPGGFRLGPHPFDPPPSADVNKHVEGSGVIQSAKFPAAQPPDPNQPSKIETEYWPCPPSLAAMGEPDVPSWFLPPLCNRKLI